MTYSMSKQARRLGASMAAALVLGAAFAGQPAFAQQKDTSSSSDGAWCTNDFRRCERNCEFFTGAGKETCQTECVVRYDACLPDPKRAPLIPGGLQGGTTGTYQTAPTSKPPANGGFQKPSGFGKTLGRGN